MKTRLPAGVLATAAFLTTTAAHAADRAACMDAVSQGQTLLDQHKLVEARDQFRVCAAAGCPSVVQADCANWLASVDTSIPAVLVDVKVRVDGQPFALRLDGDARALDPGPHVLHFEAADGATLDRQVVILEGTKDQVVDVVLGPSPPPTAPPSPATPDTNVWRTVGWAAGALGIVGIGVGTAFGFAAMGDKNGAHCNALGQCEPGPLGDARSAAVGSDIGLIAGGVLLTGGAALVLFGPRANSQETTTSRLEAAPLFGMTGGGVSVRGSW
jgi:hypothetical protein